MSVDESIALASLIADLGQYGRLSAALEGAAKNAAELQTSRHQAIQVHDFARLEQIDAVTKDLVAAEEKCRAECDPVLKRLLAADYLQRTKYRQLVIQNPSVPEQVKNGLRYDAMGLFDGGLRERSAERPSSQSIPLEPAPSCASGGAPARKLSQAGSESKANPSFSYPAAIVSTVVWVVWCLAIVVVLFSVIGFFASLSDDGAGLCSAIALCVGGLLTMGIAWGYQSITCPKCRRPWTADVVTADSLGVHIENRTEEQVAEHYGQGYTKIGETRTQVRRAVAVETFLVTKRCRKCGHVWKEKQQADRS